MLSVMYHFCCYCTWSTSVNVDSFISGITFLPGFPWNVYLPKKDSLNIFWDNYFQIRAHKDCLNFCDKLSEMRGCCSLSFYGEGFISFSYCFDITKNTSVAYIFSHIEILLKALINQLGIICFAAGSSYRCWN